MRAKDRFRSAINRFRGFAAIQGVKLPIDDSIISPTIELHLARGNYERAETRALARVLKETDTVVELGGGLGFLSTYIAKHGLAQRVVSVEANPNLIPYIRRTYTLNKIGMCEVRHGMVANKSNGTVPFHVMDDMWASSVIAGPGVKNTVQVPTIAWRDILGEVKPTVLVMDIEGGEVDVLEQCDLSSIERIVVELHPNIYGVAGLAKCYAALDRLGFEICDRFANVLGLERCCPQQSRAESIFERSPHPRLVNS